MAGIFTRPEIDKIMRNSELTDEQKTEKIFGLYGRALDDGFISKSAAEEAKQAAIEATKAGFKAQEPIDPKTTDEYLALQRERDMLRTIGGDDFATVLPKYRELVYGMLDHGKDAKPVSEQLPSVREKNGELFFPEPEPTKGQPKNTPQYSQQPTGRPGANPTSAEEAEYQRISAQWK
jgi:hypothetical protein